MKTKKEMIKQINLLNKELRAERKRIQKIRGYLGIDNFNEMERLFR